jgi:tryptophan-rich sensory protein
LVIGLLALAATATVGVVTAVLAAFAQDVWFVGLRRPAWAPSLGALVAIWSLVFATIAGAGWCLWLRLPSAPPALSWLVLLGSELTWAVVFYGLWLPEWALAVQLLLPVIAFVTAIAAWGWHRRLAAALLVPAVLWGGYLLALNIAIVVLN